MKKSERLKLTDHSFTRFRKENIPVDIITELEDLKELEFTSIKKFSRALEKKIGKERTAQYKRLILMQAEIVTRSQKSVVQEYAEALLIAILLAFVIRMFLVEAFKIPSGSMKPTLLVGDHLLVNKFLYRFTEPERGDIIVFKYPDDPDRNFIKRIIGVGGDKIEVKDKVVYLNGEKQEEPYTQFITSDIHPAGFSPRDNFGPVKVPPNSYFMMGDNRDSSLDSRFWQNRFVKRRAIVGKAFIIYWSWRQDENMRIPQNEAFADKVIRSVKTIGGYILHFPSSVRWRRFGRLIQ